MSAYEELFENAKKVAFATIGTPGPDDADRFDPMFGIVDGALHAVQDLLPDPEEVENAWLLTMLAEKPELFGMEIEENGSLAKGVIDALRDFMLDEMDDELAERARDAGFDIPVPPAP